MPIKDVVSDYATIWFYVYMYGLHFFAFSLCKDVLKIYPLLFKLNEVLLYLADT